MTRDTELATIFGVGSTGSTPEERARSSDKMYVRSQVQIAEFSEGATGHVLTAVEALDAFGVDVLRAVAEDGSRALVADYLEPAATLKSRRETLRLNEEQLAKRAHVTVSDVKTAETIGKISPIATLERIAQALALDERRLGLKGSGGDATLGVRLREMGENAGDAKRFRAGDVLDLAESAWVIARQKYLEGLLFPDRKSKAWAPRHDYTWPAYEKGYKLARETRTQLGLGTQPVTSLRILLEETLHIPVVQQSMSERFAGATVGNGTSRGIVVNEKGSNANVWVRRMTLAHELGHLLWDPDNKLSQLIVDTYDQIDTAFPQYARRDPVEVRANAFAVAFLAPPEGVTAIMHNRADRSEAVGEVMSTYGISATAARYHVANVLKIEPDASAPRTCVPSDDWVARENLMVDFFPLVSTPISRRGRFAWLVAECLQRGLISSRTGTSYLNCSDRELNDSLPRLLQLGVSSGAR